MDANEVLIGYLNDCYDIHDAKIERDLMITREERYHFAVHSTGIGVWDLLLTPNHLDTNTSCLSKNQLFWNDNMFQIYYLDRRDFKGSYDDFLECVHPDDQEKVEQHFDECFKGQDILKIKFRLIRVC